MARGGVAFRGATARNYELTGPGTAGQVLTSNGPGADPTFQAAAGGNAFGTVAVSGQSDVVADQSNDTLTLVAGSNVTITTTPGSDAVTIAASGGGTAFSGATVYKAADLTGQNYTTPAAVTWDTESYDTDNWHDNATNPSRFTVPSGVTTVDLSASIRLNNVAAANHMFISILKNGSANYVGVPQGTVETGAGGSINISCAGVGIPCVPGDYFEVFLFSETDTSVDIVANRSSFSIVATRTVAIVPADLIAIADADESVANDTIQDDDELSLAVEANTTYLLEALLMFTTGTSTTPDAKTGFTYPTGATLTFTRIGLASTATATSDMTDVARYQESSPTPSPMTHGVISTATSVVSPQWFRGVLRVGSTAGNLTLQWAQNTSTGGTPTVRKADSFLRLIPVPS